VLLVGGGDSTDDFAGATTSLLCNWAAEMVLMTLALVEQVVLANFNHLQKLGPETFKLWSKILRDNPNSKLWLLKSVQPPSFPRSPRITAFFIFYFISTK